MKERTNLLEFISKNLEGEILDDCDIIVISSKIVAIAEGGLINLKDILASEEGRALATEFGIDERFAQLILNEADTILGGPRKVIATIKRGIAIPFAGVDLSNVPLGHAVLWPKDPAGTAEEIRKFLLKSRGVKVGVIISDSQIVPLRSGTYGIALGIAGFLGAVDKRGSKDLFGKEMKVTRWGLADNLASGANLVMGEGGESSPIAIIKEAPITQSDLDAHKLTQALLMNEEECLWAQFFNYY